MKLIVAEIIAKEVHEKLHALCDRIEVAGSIRRRRADVKDIEILCIPKAECILEFTNVIHEIGPIQLGTPLRKYCKVLHPSGIKIDLFLARKDNWGLIYAIRTGSAEFSHKVLARGWVRAGFKSDNGMLTKNGRTIPVYEEQDLFDLIGANYVRPEYRDGVNQTTTTTQRE